MIKIETSILEKKYWEVSVLEDVILQNEEEFNIVRVYKEEKLQQWLGMGGAITLASVLNYQKLDDEEKKKLIEAYYNKDGLDYNWGRISIGSNDFAPFSYEYSLEFDKNNVISLLREIQKIKKLNLIATPWSPPARMKDNNSLVNGGVLLEKYYDEYADYLVNFLKDYQKEGIDIAYLTVQNEPFAKQKWESCQYSIEQLNKFTYQFLIPKLEKVKVLLWDHNKDDLYYIAKRLVKENEQIAGLAYHWYTGYHEMNLALVHKLFPNLLLVHSESCCGFSKYNEKDWIKDAVLLANDFIKDINNGMNVYLDWNILLDYNGGPNHEKNYCKSPIILDKHGSKIIKTPIYYFLGHFAKYFKPNSKIVAVSSYTDNLLACASLNEEEVVVNILNKSDELVPINLMIDGFIQKDIIKPYSIVTYIK